MYSINGKMFVLQEDTANQAQGVIKYEERQERQELTEETDAETEEPQNRKTSFSWDDSSTKLFLTQYKQYHEEFRSRKIKTKKVVWAKISRAMRNEGCVVSCLQVENKFKSLERAYKGMLFKKKTGRARATCPYQKELSEILGRRVNLPAVALMGSTGSLARQSEETNRHQGRKDLLQKRYCSTGTTADNLRKYHEMMEQFTAAVLENSTSKLNIQQEMLEEHRKIRIAQEELVQQLKKSNELKEDRNQILKQLFK